MLTDSTGFFNHSLTFTLTLYQCNAMQWEVFLSSSNNLLSWLLFATILMYSISIYVCITGYVLPFVLLSFYRNTKHSTDQYIYTKYKDTVYWESTKPFYTREREKKSTFKYFAFFSAFSLARVYLISQIILYILFTI